MSVKASASLPCQSESPGNRLHASGIDGYRNKQHPTPHATVVTLRANAASQSQRGMHEATNQKRTDQAQPPPTTSLLVEQVQHDLSVLLRGLELLFLDLARLLVLDVGAQRRYLRFETSDLGAQLAAVVVLVGGFGQGELDLLALMFLLPGSGGRRAGVRTGFELRGGRGRRTAAVGPGDRFTFAPVTGLGASSAVPGSRLRMSDLGKRSQDEGCI